MGTTTWQRSVPLRRHQGLDAQRPLMVLRNRHARGTTYAGDVHYELELGIVLSGAMKRESGGTVQVARRGQVWLCGMWEPHRYRVTQGPCEVLVLVVRPQCLAGLRFEQEPEHRWLLPFTVPAAQRPQVQGRAREEVVAWAKRMARLVDGPRTRVQRLEEQVLLLELLLLLRREWRMPSALEQAVERDPDHGVRIDQAIQLVFERRGDITAIAAARAVGLSRNRFNRLFVDLMGDSFAHFAAGYRLGGAAADLARGEEPLKAIARSWGFTDASHLVRRFRLSYGCTPAQYRLRMRGLPSVAE
ncbi:MAG: AraC family transcriptional regulator [Planctomycetes bacterium]|nr:AraC family transcriptional regulator [Planctomycetota bacterium]